MQLLRRGRPSLNLGLPNGRCVKVLLAARGRPLPTGDVGYPVAQLGGQLSGGELARPTGAGRPIPGIPLAKSLTAKQPSLGPVAAAAPTPTTAARTPTVPLATLGLMALPKRRSTEAAWSPLRSATKSPVGPPFPITGQIAWRWHTSRCILQSVPRSMALPEQRKVIEMCPFSRSYRIRSRYLILRPEASTGSHHVECNSRRANDEHTANRERKMAFERLTLPATKVTQPTQASEPEGHKRRITHRSNRRALSGGQRDPSH